MNMQHYILRVLLVFACLFVLFSHSLTVCAADSSETSTFFGTEYPLSIARNSGISTFAMGETNGYSYYAFYEDINGDVWNFAGETLDLSDIEVPLDNGVFSYYYKLFLPEQISRGTVFDLEILITHTEGDLNVSYLSLESSNGDSVGKHYNPIVTKIDNNTTRISFLDISSSVGIVENMRMWLKYTPADDITLFESTISSISVKEVSSSGLLGGILEWIKSILQGIIDLPTNIANSIKGFFDNIVNAVVNLGNFIIDGIKGLFIPSEEDITNMKDKWDTLLSDRFGALYQVAAIIADYASSFTEQSKKTITFPTVSIPLGEATFEFGGWEVQVVPDGFDILINALKLITSIACTFLFINGLRNKYDQIMGGADNI